MSNQLAKAGAQSSKPPKYAPIWSNNFYQGIVTQRNPLRANLGHIEEEFYGTQPCFIDGLNCEISASLTPIRRPGLSAYNSQTFPAITRFYENRTNTYNTSQTVPSENIQVIADTASVVYDATGPSTNKVLFTKSSGAGSTYFQSVGNSLYFSDGVDQEKLLTPSVVWGASETFTVGQWIIDTNGNIQSFQDQPITLNITGIAVVSASPTELSDAQTFLVVTLGSPPPVLQPCQLVAFTGLTTYTSLNGVSLTYQNISSGWGLNLSPLQIAFKYTASVYAQASDTGTASTFVQYDVLGNPLTGITGSSQPSWSSTQYGTTTDGTVQWTCYGSPLQTWQLPAPAVSPVVSPTVYNAPASASNICNYWQPNTQITIGSTQSVIIFDSNGNLQIPKQALGGNGPASTYIPTAWNLTGAATVLNPTYGYSGVSGQYADLSAGGLASALVYSGFTSVVLSSAGTLSMTLGFDITGETGAVIYYSINGGSSWTQIWSTGTPFPSSPNLYQVTIPIGTNISNVQVKIDPGISFGSGLDSNDVYISKINLTTGTSSGVFTGFTGANQPEWSESLGGTTNDNQVVWENLGKISTWLPSYQYPLAVTVLQDSNGNLQYTNQLFQTQTVWTSGTANTSGATNTTGTTQPVWATTLGSATADGAYSWICLGPGAQLTAGTLQWSYSYHCIDGSVTTAAPVSYALNPIAGSPGLYEIQIVARCSPSPQVDQIWLWRTVGGGSTLFFLDQVPNNFTAGSLITYIDSLPDASPSGGNSLDQFIEAPVDESSDPPPSGLTALSYHLGRVFGAVGNTVQYSQGPDVSSGNGNTAWDPSNVFVFPSSVTRLFPTSNGLLVFTTSDIYIIQGLGTQASELFSVPFLSNIGLVSYDAFSVNGSIVYLYASDNQVITLDPSSGVSEIGFPIGDQFGPLNGTETFTPTSTKVTWHVAGSPDKGLYVSDSQGTWWRLCPTPSPETGTTWSPKAQPIGGFSCVQSVETSPGTRNLLVGPKTSGPILKRDYTVYSDNGSAYDAYAVLGSIVLAQPGQMAHVKFITTDSWARGTPISLAVQLDEIAPISSGYFENLSAYVPDPTQLTASNSIYAQRFYLSQTQDPSVCRHLQIQINWGTDTVKNELLSLTIFGAYEGED